MCACAWPWLVKAAAAAAACSGSGGGLNLLHPAAPCTPPNCPPPLQGYTIPLDKRLAADGRGLQEVQINDQFAKFTEVRRAALDAGAAASAGGSVRAAAVEVVPTHHACLTASACPLQALYIAEHKARSAVEARSKMQRELLAREKESKEAELRELALKARMDRLGGAPGGPAPAAGARGGGVGSGAGRSLPLLCCSAAGCWPCWAAHV